MITSLYSIFLSILCEARDATHLVMYTSSQSDVSLSLAPLTEYTQISITMDSLLKVFHAIPWRLVLPITLCLMALPIFFFDHDNSILQAFHSTESSSHASKLASDSLANIWPWGRPSPETSYIAFCMAVKDQGPDLEEYFVHHYYHHGITRFYIMDDGSDPPLSSFEYPGVPRSILTFVYQDQAIRGHDTQVDIYASCQRDYGHLHTWIAYLDADEFLETPGNETLREILEDFEADDTVGALAMNWKMHGSSGLLTRPESVRKSFVDCVSDRDEDTHGGLTDNRHVKVIVRTDKGIKPLGPHSWIVKNNTVGEHGGAIGTSPFRRPITRDRIAVHHYATKSKEEYEEKKHRGNAMTDPKGDQFWIDVNEIYTLEECKEMVDYDP